MFGECHGHIFMDGIDFKKARALHRDGGQVDVIREHLKAYEERGITFFRDGGDACGASVKARELAGEYGIDYRTPIFAIHKKGYYGGIVGRAFSDMGEYIGLVREAKRQGADFIKIMTTGLMDFNSAGVVTGQALEFDEVKEMVRIAHGEGLAVMSHTNGSLPVIQAVQAGVDSLEHGNFLTEEAAEALAGSGTVYVPTVATIGNLLDCGRYPREEVEKIWESARTSIRMVYQKGGGLALGSDAGAYQVFHGQGLQDEYAYFRKILLPIAEEGQLMQRLRDGEAVIRQKFHRNYACG